MAAETPPSTGTFQTPIERLASGRALREKCPRSSHGPWKPAADRPDPIALLMAENVGRQANLLPVKFNRMKASPFGFYRGAAPLMATDLAPTPATGLHVQICGDAHVKNLGAYAAPDGRLVFDINDFDETIVAPWEWDVKRMAASIILAGRDAQDKMSDCREAVREFVEAYRNAMWTFSTMKALDLMKHEVLSTDGKKNGLVQVVLKKAELASPEKNLQKLTEPVKDGWRKFHTDPPMVSVSPDIAQSVLNALKDYRSTLGASRRLTLDSYQPHDVAFKIVGTGSVGLLDYVVLLFGNGPDDPLFIQVKQAMPACYTKYLPNAPVYEHQGKRIAEGQYCLQTVTDPFVGWTTIGGNHFLVRQLADRKASIDPAELSGDTLIEYGVVCGKMLAKAHARTGDAAMIVGYCGKSGKFDSAIVQFASAYYDQTIKDFDAFSKKSNDDLMKMVGE